MIVASLLLIPVAFVLLAVGLVASSAALLVVSIAASLVAAIGLLAATRLAAARGRDGPAGLVDPMTAGSGWYREAAGRRRLPQPARYEALVVVGRRHYHLPGCPGAADGTRARRPLSEAEQFGLTPCPVCQPDLVIFVDADRA